MIFLVSQSVSLFAVCSAPTYDGQIYMIGEEYDGKVFCFKKNTTGVETITFDGTEYTGFDKFSIYDTTNPGTPYSVSYEKNSGTDSVTYKNQSGLVFMITQSQVKNNSNSNPDGNFSTELEFKRDGTMIYMDANNQEIARAIITGGLFKLTGTGILSPPSFSGTLELKYPMKITIDKFNFFAELTCKSEVNINDGIKCNELSSPLKDEDQAVIGTIKLVDEGTKYEIRKNDGTLVTN